MSVEKSNCQIRSLFNENHLGYGGGVYIAADYGSNKKDMTFEENKIENLRSQYKPWLTSDERKFLIEGR